MVHMLLALQVQSLTALEDMVRRLMQILLLQKCHVEQVTVLNARASSSGAKALDSVAINVSAEVNYDSAFPTV